jgi:hypothetical protein
LEGAYLRMGHGVLGHGGLLSVNCTSAGHVTSAAYSREEGWYMRHMSWLFRVNSFREGTL